jgi:hypothetical protein
MTDSFQFLLFCPKPEHPSTQGMEVVGLRSPNPSQEPERVMHGCLFLALSHFQLATHLGSASLTFL